MRAVDSPPAPVVVADDGLPVIGERPTDEVIAHSRAFPRGLVAVDGAGATAGSQEQANAEMGAFLRRYRALGREDAFAALDGYLAQAPERWRAALTFEWAVGKYQRGYFAEAMEAWEGVWASLKDAAPGAGGRLADEALGRMLDVHIGMGRAEPLRRLIAENEGRAFSGHLEGKLLRGKQTVWLLEHFGAQNVQCGSRALHAVMDFQRADYDPIRLNNVSNRHIATGVPMTQLRDWAADLGWDTAAVVRSDAGAPAPTPSVMHTHDGHYAALLDHDLENGRYFLEDRGMGFADWVDAEAVEALSSDRFLVARNDVAVGGIPDGFDVMGDAEAAETFGRDGAHGLWPTSWGSTPGSRTSGGNRRPCKKGMANYSFLTQMAGLRLFDVPLGYTPPVGAPVNCLVTYNDVDDSQPGVSPSVSNVGRMWNLTWVAYLEHVTGTLNNGKQVTVHVPGGGVEVSRYNVDTEEFGPNDRSFAWIERTGTATYTRYFRDGSKEVYDTPDNPANPSRVFLTRIVDASGNEMSFTYDAQLRLVGVGDAIGQTTTLFYEHPTDAFKVTRVEDPFGREASFAYNASGQLVSITDVIGMVSAFTYGDGDFVTSLTTPYGTTVFEKTPGSNSWDRILTATDPIGHSEKIQFADPGTAIPSQTPPANSVFVGGEQVTFYAEEARLQFRNSYYWNKEAYHHGKDDVTMAVNTRWYTDPSWLVTPIIEAVKEPGEERVWFNYPGTAGAFRTGYPNYPGKSAVPEKTLRMMSDGTAQVAQNYTNRYGLPVKVVDPVGRTTLLTYAANEIDVLETRQKTEGGELLLQSATYNAAHQLLTSTDASGQTSTFVYNPRGQVTSITNALGEVTTMSYDADGYLLHVDGPLPGAGDRTVFTYDPAGRVRTITRPDGHVLAYEYDDLDRVTMVTYPDGTWEAITYDRLMRGVYRDRLGREVTYTYNAERQVETVTDSQGRELHYEWCRCGDPRKMTDQLGRETRWEYDAQGRMISKTMPDGSQSKVVYDEATGWVRQRIDERGQTILYSYNLDATLRSISYPDAEVPTPPVTFTYDPVFQRIATRTDGAGTTTYSYHPITNGVSPGAGELASVDGPLPNDTVTYQYDALNRVVSRDLAGATETVAYDAAGRITGATNPLGAFTFEYDGAMNRRTVVTAPNGMRSVTTYGGAADDFRLERIRNERADASLISQFDYEFDAAGRMTEWVQLAEGGTPRTWTFTYDPSDQLLGASGSGGGLPAETWAWAYDAAGNRTSETRNGVVTEYEYNALNQLVSLGGAVDEREFEWDAEQRLAAIVDGERRSEFSYDGEGRRVGVVEKGAGGTVLDSSSFVWIGGQIVEERDGPGTTLKRRFWRQGTEDLRGGGGAVNGFYTFDHLGSIREVVGDSEAVEQRVGYEFWGDSTLAQAGNAAPLFQFTGHHRHEASGLYLTQHRAYDPDAGRWISRDPMGEEAGSNLYAYVLNNPLIAIDPDGRILHVLGGGLVGGVIGGGVSWATGGSFSSGFVKGAIAGAAVTALGPGAAALTGGGAMGAFFSGGAIAAGSNIVGQGATIGLGLQDCFSWTEVGVSGFMGGLFSGAGQLLRDARIPSNQMVDIGRWGRPGLRSGDWVQPGNVSNFRTYFWTFKWDPSQRFAWPSSGEGFRVPAGSLRWPTGWGIDGWWKGLFGQRIYVP